MDQPTAAEHTGNRDAPALPDAIVFIDGECAFCSNSARFMLHNDPSGRIHIATLQGELAGELLPALGKDADYLLRARTDNASIDGIIIVLHPGTARAVLYERSRASRMIARLMRFPYSFLGWVSWWMPDRLLDPLYGVVKRYRHRLSRNTCALPEPSQRSRYLN